MNGIGRVSFRQQFTSPYWGINIIMSVKGTDVSFYQDDNNTARGIDFVRMRDAGAKFTFIRVGQNLWIDPDFATNWAAARQAGLIRGCYYLMDSRVTPTEQAELFYDQIKNDMPEAEIVVDYEESYGGAYGGWRNLKAFIEHLMLKGIPASKIMIYTGYYYWREHCPTNADDLNWFKQFKLWIAWYTTNPANVSIPAPWTNSDLLFWQYTDNGDGTFYGVESGRIDLNWFTGSDADFNARYSQTPEPPPVGYDVHLFTHDGVEYFEMVRFGVKCFVHKFDTHKVRIFVTPGPYRPVRDMVNSYAAQGGFNGGGWPNVQTAENRANEIWVSEGDVLQATAKDDRPYINVAKDGTVRISPNDRLDSDLWNTWGYDRLLGTNGVFNEAISDRTTKDSRTFSGITADGKLVIVVCEGNDVYSRGLTFPECWSVLREFDVITGGNNDGGSSSSAFNLAIKSNMLNVPSTGTEANVLNHVLFFAEGEVTPPPPPPPGGTVKRYRVITSVRPRSAPTLMTSDTSPNIPVGVEFDSATEPIEDELTSSHPMMVKIESGTWNGKYVPLVYLGTEYTRDVTPVTPPSGRKAVKVIIEYDDLTTEELFPLP